MSAARTTQQVFDQYQKSRLHFVQTVAEAAQRPQNIEALHSAGVLALLRPLLLDTVPAIQHSAALALGRLANYSNELAEAVVSNEILPQLVYSLKDQNRYYKKAVAFVLRAVAKHSSALAQAVVDTGALDCLVQCLEEFDPTVKESAAWAIGYIARHTAELAQVVVDAGAVGLLVLCLQEPELSLKRLSASAIADIAKHSPELAQAVVDAGAITHSVSMIGNPDGFLKRQVYGVLSNIAKHSVDLAETVVEAEVLPKILLSLKDIDPLVRKQAATLVREVVKHTAELAQLIVSQGGVGSLVEFIVDADHNDSLPGVMALGYLAAYSETLAIAVIKSEAILPLYNILSNESEDHVKSAAAWSLGQLGRHTSEHTKMLVDENVLSCLVSTYISENSSDDLKAKCKRSLELALEKLTDMAALDSLLQQPNISEDIIQNILAQIAKVIPNDPKGRMSFVTTGGFAKMQNIPAESGSELKEHIDVINSCYPEDIVNYYSPHYSTQLLQKIDTLAVR